MDWGSKENIIRYGQPTPPPYNLTTVTAPVVVFWGENDWLATPKVMHISEQFPKYFLSPSNGRVERSLLFERSRLSSVDRFNWNKWLALDNERNTSRAAHYLLDC